MNVRLLHPHRSLDADATPPPRGDALTEDLALDTVFAAMAAGDDFIESIARKVVPASLTDQGAIIYRQQVMTDCLANPDVVRQLYALTVGVLNSRRSALGFWVPTNSPESTLSFSLRTIGVLLDYLRELGTVATVHAADFRSDGFTSLFSQIVDDLDAGYLDEVERRLEELRFKRGTLISAGLGPGNQGVEYALHEPPHPSGLARLTHRTPHSVSFTIPDRDDHGLHALGVLRSRGLRHVADALARSADHVLGFIEELRAELAFYVGCLNLHDRLVAAGAQTCTPEVTGPGEPMLTGRGLCDVVLLLQRDRAVVGNDFDTGGRALVVVTGANQGGKSTFLRSVGVAQLMTQCGMFVAAAGYRANVHSGIFTHFIREEDPALASGKLDEELGRMRLVIDSLEPGALLLCNESFASTNDREGSEIARQVVEAVTESGVTIVFVTHLVEFADRRWREHRETTLFLRAERAADGERPYRLTEDRPLGTSFGLDTFRRIIGDTRAARADTTTDPSSPGAVMVPGGP